MNSRERKRRLGVTLLELVMVITIMGILAAIGTARYGRSAYANFGSQGEARTVSLVLLRAHRSAIKTGDDHFVQFNAVSPTRATQYSLMRRAGNGTTSLVEGPYVLNADVRVTSSAANLNFNFEGEAAAAYQVDFIGSGQSWRVNVVPITGAVVVSQVAP
jgi:prepilin-type N-terminal cleavage/methylation domain-containing protein